MDEQFKIDYQFAQYLKRVKLDQAAMPKQQYTALRQAFFAAWSAMLVLMQGPIPDLPEADGVKVLEYMTAQCEQFWRNQIK